MTLENMKLEGEEPPGDEDAENNIKSREDNHTNCSEIRLDLEKIMSNVPVVSDTRPPKFRRRYRQIQRTFPLSNELNIMDANKNHAQTCVHSEESTSGSYGNRSLINFPAKTTASSYVFENSSDSRTSRSINNLSDFFVEYSHDVQSGNVTMSSSPEWAYNFIEEMVKKKGLVEISLSFVPFKPDFSTRQIGSNSPTFYGQLSIDQELARPQRKQGKLFVSHLSTRSPEHGFSTSGLIYCVWESSIPYFLFIVDGDEGEIYAASPLKARSAGGKPLDYIYLFHTWKARGKVSKKNVANAPHLVAKMTVSSSLVVDLNRSKFMETEFVLFDANKERLAEKEKSSSNFMKGNGQSRKLTELFRQIRPLKHNPKHWVGPNELQTIDESVCENHLANDFSPNFELTAIVIRDHGYNSSKAAAFGGWGLKFLEKVDQNGADFSQDLPPSSYDSCEKQSTIGGKKTSSNVTVLVPDGTHGGPVISPGGPSGLTERWKSGGHCDCGGWDIGCPLKVLKDNSICSKDSEEDCKSFELFKEGGEHGEPKLKMLKMSKDMYVVNYQSTISALQAFSITVAFIHSQQPDLYPKM
ncbi:hypothetical protein Cni_G14895 [Canna indica]|uniref:Uncharacterized protein n=1 Tax=Canna indica TaxID=4628 RepID=A0AAQ3QEE2_9LILI|nr:hypothetical protein Cni_G14895 [Canna indica]